MTDLGKRWIVAVLAVAALSSGVIGFEPKFFRDDPLAREAETEDASGVRPTELSEMFEIDVGI